MSTRNDNSIQRPAGNASCYRQCLILYVLYLNFVFVDLFTTTALYRIPWKGVCVTGMLLLLYFHVLFICSGICYI